MSEQSTSGQQTGMDRFFTTLRGVGIRRRTHDKWIAGVCSGLADRLGVDPVIVRAGLVLLSLLGGAGITIYLLAWALIPNDREEILAQRALRDADVGSIVLVVLAAMSLFGGAQLGGPWWMDHSGWGFPWGLALVGLLVWWLVQRSGNNPDADEQVQAHRLNRPQGNQPGRPQGTQEAMPTGTQVAQSRKLRRRSGGLLMAVFAVGLAITTYGTLIWAANTFSWTGDHEVIAAAGSLAAIGLLLVVLGFAGWRAGFVAFLAVALAATTFTSSAIPAGIDVGGRVGDATWTPTSVAAGSSYHLGVGDGVLNLSALPGGTVSTGSPTPTPVSPPTIAAYVGIGELRVVVPKDLTVEVVGHASLGEILLPTDPSESGQGGSDVSRSVVVGDGPTEVVVNAGVGIGQLTVVKE